MHNFIELLNADRQRARGDWADAIAATGFRPALYRGGTWYEFPPPTLTLRLAETWDAERFKIPLRDGDTLVGHSRNGVDIVIRGELGSAGNDPPLDEPALFALLDGLRTALHVSSDDDRFWFYLFRDESSDTFRHFRECSTLRFEYDLSDTRLVTWIATIHAADPTLYDALPD